MNKTEITKISCVFNYVGHCPNLPFYKFSLICLQKLIKFFFKKWRNVNILQIIKVDKFK